MAVRENISKEHLDGLVNDVITSCLIIGARSSEHNKEIRVILDSVDNLYVNYGGRCLADERDN